MHRHWFVRSFREVSCRPLRGFAPLGGDAPAPKASGCSRAMPEPRSGRKRRREHTELCEVERSSLATDEPLDAPPNNIVKYCIQDLL